MWATALVATLSLSLGAWLTVHYVLVLGVVRRGVGGRRWARALAAWLLPLSPLTVVWAYRAGQRTLCGCWLLCAGVHLASVAAAYADWGA